MDGNRTGKIALRASGVNEFYRLNLFGSLLDRRGNISVIRRNIEYLERFRPLYHERFFAFLSFFNQVERKRVGTGAQRLFYASFHTNRNARDTRVGIVRHEFKHLAERSSRGVFFQKNNHLVVCTISAANPIQFHGEERTLTQNVTNSPVCHDAVDSYSNRRIRFWIDGTEIYDSRIDRNVVADVHVRMKLHLHSVGTCKTYGNRSVFISGEILRIYTDVNDPLLACFDGSSRPKRGSRALAGRRNRLDDDVFLIFVCENKIKFGFCASNNGSELMRSRLEHVHWEI